MVNEKMFESCYLLYYIHIKIFEYLEYQLYLNKAFDLDMNQIIFQKNKL